MDSNDPVYTAYKAHKFSPEKIALIAVARDIIDEYRQEGFKLTLRQLYYQFVARDIIPNTERSYKNLGTLISNARLAGVIDWTAIEDRTRFLRKEAHWDSPADILRGASHQFRFDKWDTQPNYVEVWIEKDALVGILERVCKDLDVPIMSCRGYGSQSMMWESAQRFLAHENQRCYIIHLGDHDPSGIDMTRDIEDRLYELRVCNLDVRRVALNLDQIDEYDPPPNPTKLSDTRAKDYVVVYGQKSWELDALEPKVLEGIVEKEVESLMDHDKFAQRSEDEDEARAQLQELAEQFEGDNDGK